MFKIDFMVPFSRGHCLHSRTLRISTTSLGPLRVAVVVAD